MHISFEDGPTLHTRARRSQLNMKLLSVVLVATLAVALAEDRTLGGATSGLANLINPGAQGPYPSAPPAPYPQSAPYAPEAPAPEHYTSWDNQPEQTGFTVQSGYEGFLLPTGPAPEPHSALLPLGGLALGASLLKHFLPFPFNKIAFFLSTKIGLWVVGLTILTLLGGAATTALCAFTPLCTISFLGLGKFNRESTRALLSQDHLNSLTSFVHDAIDTYRKLQTRVSKAAKSKKFKEAKEIKEAKEAEAIKEVKEEVKIAKEEVKIAKEETKEINVKS